MTRKGHIIEEHDVAVRVVGDLSMVPENVAEAAEDVRKLTGHRTGCTLNIALAYASRREMAHLATTGSLWVPTPVQKPPLFIRTSGEHRFSDFLIWQSSFAHLCFQSVLWPDYRSWHLFKALVQYNKYYAVTLRAMKSCQDQNTYFKASV
ncbi:Isoprenyl transferase [Diplonema papillatum]|nr:Isoprenyl transferase [Diplonema papillatum]